MNINYLQNAISRTVQGCLIKKVIKEINAYLLNYTGPIAIWCIRCDEGVDGKAYYFHFKLGVVKP